MMAAEMRVNVAGFRIGDKGEERCSSSHPQPRALQHCMQAGAALVDAAADRRNIRAQQRTRNRKSRAGDRPGTEPVFETRENIIPRNRKTEP